MIFLSFLQLACLCFILFVRDTVGNKVREGAKPLSATNVFGDVWKVKSVESQVWPIGVLGGRVMMNYRYVDRVPT